MSSNPSDTIPVLTRSEVESLIEIIFQKAPSDSLKKFLLEQETILIPSRTFVCRFRIRVEPYSTEPTVSNPESGTKETLPKYFVYQDDLNDETYLIEDFVIRKDFDTNLKVITKVLQDFIFPSAEDRDLDYFMNYDKIICYEDPNQGPGESKLHICLMSRLDDARMFTNKYSNLFAIKINPYEVNEMIVQIKKVLKKLNKLFLKDQTVSDKKHLFPISPLISPRAIYSFRSFEFKISLFFSYIDDYKETFTKSVCEEISKILEQGIIKSKDTKEEIPRSVLFDQFLPIWIKGLAFIGAKPFLSTDKPIDPLTEQGIEEALKKRKEKFDKVFTPDFEIFFENYMYCTSKQENKVTEYIFPDQEFQEIKNYLLLNFFRKTDCNYKENVRKNDQKLNETIPEGTDPFSHIKTFANTIEQANKNSKTFKVREPKDKEDSIAIEVELVNRDVVEPGKDRNEKNFIVAEIIPFWPKQFIDFKSHCLGISMNPEFMDDLNSLFNTLSEELEYINAEVEQVKDKDGNSTPKAVFRSAMILQPFDDIASNIIYSLDLLILMAAFSVRKLKQEMGSDKFGWISRHASGLVAEAKGLIRQYKKFWNENADWLKAERVAY